MSIKNPITKPSQMRNPLVCKPMSEEHRNFLIADHTWWAKEAIPQPANPQEAAKMKKMFVLRDRLLSFGGNEACLPIVEEDFDAIMQRGQLFYGKGSRMRRGLPSQCHYNSSLLWKANVGHCQIATGYALSEDGIWRQHSWVVQPLTVKYRVWETTTPRVAYFGFVMTDEECQDFFDWNT